MSEMGEVDEEKKGNVLWDEDEGTERAKFKSEDSNETKSTRTLPDVEMNAELFSIEELVEPGQNCTQILGGKQGKG
jgi:hypothetical protein